MSEFGNTIICGSLFIAKFQNKSTQPYDATNENLALFDTLFMNLFSSVSNKCLGNLKNPHENQLL